MTLAHKCKRVFQCHRFLKIVAVVIDEEGRFEYDLFPLSIWHQAEREHDGW